MRKMLSLSLMAALSIMLAYGVTLAAGGDRAYGQGTITVSDDPGQPLPNDVWMVIEYEGMQIGDWSKTNAILGDPTVTPTQNTFSQVLLLKNKKTVDCSANICPSITDPLPEYKLMIDWYEAQDFKANPIQESDPVEVKIVDLSDDSVIYQGDLVELNTLPFKVGYTYVDILDNNSIIREEITELEFTFYYPENAENAYVEYGIVAQELPSN